MDDFLQNEALSENLLKLSELFPDITLRHIMHILKISNDDFDSSVEQILNYELIKDELEKIDEEENQKNILLKKKPSEWEIIESQKHNAYVKPKGRKKGKQGNDNNNHTKMMSNCSSRRSSVSVSNSTKLSTFGNQKRRTSLTASSDSMMSGLRDNDSNVHTSSNLLASTMESLHIKELAKKLELEDEIMEILEISEKDRDLVDWYVTQNSLKKINIIYDIMLNFSPDETIDNQPRNKIDTVSLDILFPSDQKRTRGVMSMAELIKHGVGSIPTADSSWDELQSLIDDNPELDLPKKFYLLAMNWYEKDLAKILHAAIVLNNCFQKKPKINKIILDINKIETQNYNNATGNDVYDIESDGFFKVDGAGRIDKTEFVCDEDIDTSTTSSNLKSLDSLEWRANKLKSSRDTTNNKLLKSFYSQSISETKSNMRSHHESTQSKELKHKIENAKKSFVIDCHSLSVENALIALKESLAYWWDLEMYYRNVKNTRFEVTSVTHLQPFTIITGRGLHSGGSIPKIKNATIRYLNANGYKFDERISTIKVLGKHKTRK